MPRRRSAAGWAEFSGTVRTANNGGFASARYSPNSSLAAYLSSNGACHDAKAWAVPHKTPKPIDTTNYNPDDTESNFWHWHPGGQTTFAALGY